VGYQNSPGRRLRGIQGGNLASAFGAFPLHYDDADNALLDLPLSYTQYIGLRNDQLPCGVADCLGKTLPGLNHCGGPSGADDGMTPVNLYGMPAIQAEVSSHRLDGRIQLASGSPSGPLSLSHASQYAQWVAGGGYTIRQGSRRHFRIPRTLSDPDVVAALPLGNDGAQLPGQWSGLETQWAAGHWSVQRRMAAFPVRLPWFHSGAFGDLNLRRSQAHSDAPILRGGPRGLVQAGWGSRCERSFQQRILASIASYELAGGWWVNRHQLLKASYEWLSIEHLRNAEQYCGVQFVTTFPRHRPGVSLSGF